MTPRAPRSVRRRPARRAVIGGAVIALTLTAAACGGGDAQGDVTSDYDATSLAFFGELSRPLGAATTLTGGLRWEQRDAEFGTLRHARGVVALREDAVAVAILAEGLPSDDEVACRVHRDRRDGLIVDGGGIDAKLIR